jgi:hypothetical protein
MRAPNHKLNRSGFFTSLNLVCPCNQLRAARLDFWGGVALVCLLGTLARLAQVLLSQ